MSDPTTAPLPPHPRNQEWLDRRHAALSHVRRLMAVCRDRIGDGDKDWLDVFETLSALRSNLNVDYENVAAGRDVRDKPAGLIEVDLSATDYYQASQHGLPFVDED